MDEVTTAGRPWRVRAVVIAIVIALSATTAGVAHALSFGSEPLDDVLAASASATRCGLTQEALAAMVIAPTYPETGAGNGTPSPMTLSRYDNQEGLHAFGNTDAAYARAFFHPGIGAWQFDSAGARPYSAESYISTGTAAGLATTEMARRYCQAASSTNPVYTEAQRRASAWQPWVGCRQGDCEDIFNELYDPTTQSLRALTRDTSVSRLGGMQSRECTLPGVAPFPCWYVDPAQAQGARGFLAPGFGPSPLTAPFYVYSSDGREYRHWVVADTGYDKEISASKPLTANARTSLTWSDTPMLCDQTVGRGTCDVAPAPKKTRVLSVAGVYDPVVGDFRGLGHDDILWFSASGGDLLWRSTTDGTFTPASISVAGALTPIVGDFDGDEHDDIYWFSPTQGDALYRGTDTGFTATYPNSNGNFTALVGDFDGDSRDDIYWFSKTGGDAIYYGTPTGFRATYPNANGDFTGHPGDFDGDGRDDIYWFSKYGGDAIYYGTPTGFRATYPNANGDLTVHVGDFDGDEIDDIYWFSPTAGDALYYGNPGGFTASYPNANGPFAPVVIDVDQVHGDDIVWYGSGNAVDAYWTSTGIRSSPFHGGSTILRNVYRPVVGQFDSHPGTDVLWYDWTGSFDPLWYG